VLVGACPVEHPLQKAKYMIKRQNSFRKEHPVIGSWFSRA